MTPSELHDAAMAHAEAADTMQAAGRGEEAVVRFAQALELERRAAMAVESEPSRSILFRSAAWLALEARDAREAERMAALGLSGDSVPARVARELRAVMEQARVQLHVDRPPPSQAAALGIHLDGDEISWGEGPVSEVLPRALNLQRILVRSAERRLGEPFRTRGPARPHIVQQLQPRVRLGSGSMVVHIVLGGSQREIWDRNQDLVADVQRALSAWAAGEDLADLIPDQNYRENFDALANTLAPDGSRVRTVRVLGASTAADLAPFLLRRRLRPRAPAGSGEVLELVGELRGVDETTSTNKIKLLMDGGKTKSLTVGDAVMEDIVHPFYGQTVRLQAIKKARGLHLVGLPELA